jgi:hypothetical protein
MSVYASLREKKLLFYYTKKLTLSSTKHFAGMMTHMCVDTTPF